MRSLLLATLALVLFLTPAKAEERYHAANGTGQFVSDTDFVSRGMATHLGLFDEAGSALFGDMSDPTAIPVVGWAVHTAANGDELHEEFSGTLNALTGAGTANITYCGGTGRFADASGSAVFSLQLVGGGAFVYSGEGVIDY